MGLDGEAATGGVGQQQRRQSVGPQAPDPAVVVLDQGPEPPAMTDLASVVATV